MWRRRPTPSWHACSIPPRVPSGLEEGDALLARMQAARAGALKLVEKRANDIFRAAILRASAAAERGVDPRELARVAWERAAKEDTSLRAVTTVGSDPTADETVG